MFSFASMVRYSETDETGYLSLIGLMNYLQDCCIFHSEALKVGPDYLREHHRAWLLSGWQIVIDRYPEMFEKITVETFPYSFSGCLELRNVLMLDEQGICIARANSVWVYLNTDTGRPERPDAEEIAVYGAEDQIPMEYASRKIMLPENMRSGIPIPVAQDFIDINHHVNNARYVEIAGCMINERYPETNRLPVKELRVEYKKQARPGAVFYPKTGDRDGWYYAALGDESGDIYASVALLF